MSARRSIARCAAAAGLLLAWNSATAAGSPRAGTASLPAAEAAAAGGAASAQPPLSASIPDGSGGTIVVWQDFRSGTNEDIYAQKLNGVGVQQWGAGGVAVCTAAGRQLGPQIVSDGAGGAIVTWLDSRSGAAHVYARRLDAAGVPQWAADGVALCTAASFQSNPQIASDGSGGAIVVWEDLRGASRDIYARRVDAAGVAQWTADGVALCTAARDQITPQIAPDASGGAVVCWSDLRFGVDNDIYAQRISSTGVPQWSPDGVALCIAIGSQYHPQMVADGAGGASVAWEDHRNAVDYDIYVQEVDGAGMPQWEPDGVALCASARDQLRPQIVSDGAGGSIVTWEDYRIGSFLESDVYARRVNSAGVPRWTADGVALCIAPYGQSSPQLLPDGDGGAIVAWADGRSGSNDDIYAQRVDSTGVTQWTADGVVLCAATGDQRVPQIGPDAADGAIVVWHDQRSTTDDDVYAQRVGAAGTVQWAVDGAGAHIEPGVQRLPAACSDGGTGVLVAWQEKRGANYDIALRRFDAAGAALWPAAIASEAPNAQVNAVIAPDGAGGAIVAWMDYRNGADADVYAQRVSAAGAAQWTAGGVAICVAAGDQVSPRLVPDGAGGAIVTWSDRRNGVDYDIHARRVDGAGTPRWIDDGVAICAATGNQVSPQLVSDGAGGAIVAWQDLRDGSFSSDIYVRRVDAAGVPQWAADGVALCAAPGIQRFPQITLDGAGGAIAAWEDRRGANYDVYARRVDAAGVPQWAADGVALCTAAGNQDSPQIVRDGSGGAIVSWRDGRAGANPDVYARRVDAAGTAQWTADGVALCTQSDLQDRPRIVADGAGGAIVAWEDHRTGSSLGADIYARRVDAAGAPQWAAGGVALCTASGPQSFPAIATDGAGGAFVMWADRRDATQDFVYVQRIGAGGAPALASDGVTPTLVSLVSVETVPGRVRLVWYAGGGPGLHAAVYRATRTDGWSAAGSLFADGTGRLDYEDRAVIPGERYGYRLGVLEDGVERFSGETWVDVPLAAGLALHGAEPNPAVDELWVSFSLPDGAPATLALFDLAGRRVRSREVGSMGAGEWRVSLGAVGRMPPGVYVLRLRQGDRSHVRRVAVAR